jgi:hypothetical protein
MNGYLTPTRFGYVLSLPVSFAQTELLRNQVLQVAQVQIAQGQRLELRHISLHLIRFMTPGVLPRYTNTSLGACSIGLYDGPTVTSPLTYARISAAGTASINAFAKCAVPCGGVYHVFVSNNTYNIDMSVAVSGCLRLYLDSNVDAALQRLGGVYT